MKKLFKNDAHPNKMYNDFASQFVASVITCFCCY